MLRKRQQLFRLERAVLEALIDDEEDLVPEVSIDESETGATERRPANRLELGFRIMASDGNCCNR